MTEQIGTATAHGSIPELLVSAAESFACLTLHLTSGRNATGYVLAANEHIVELLSKPDGDPALAQYYAVAHVIGAQYN
ncbi:hypothetical protein QNA23_10695 [Rhodococcus erythropolis]|uniref:hypothetical protein n=1 Tax=Rhodococcus erythropolis TaxID=1833 RepID=UPI0024BAC8E8|nr:hypothetical protein [Rhodococcus erythropolis]MDJ0403950.1 hypothetical protein [Rhodococcus erythropolis]